MVLLLRAFTHVDAYAEALELAGLDPYVVGGRGYWSSQQVTDALGLLAVANPLDDEALLGPSPPPPAGSARTASGSCVASPGGGTSAGDRDGHRPADAGEDGDPSGPRGHRGGRYRGGTGR